MTGYMTAQEAAVKWGVSRRQVQVLCKSNRVPGVTRVGRNWLIPEGAGKPTGISQSGKPVNVAGSGKGDPEA